MFSFGVSGLQTAKKTPTPPSSIALDEDAQKRNTDCIYFLASPLTCKKGDKCEYRHSEAARVNPRDCRFWKSGNCLNAYCSFRHLPLEGKPAAALGPATSMAHTKMPTAPAMSTTAGVGPSKSKTPCYFFAQGYCAKSDQCPYKHSLLVGSSKGEAAAQQNLAGVDGKVTHAMGRPVILLKQSGLLPQEVRPVTDRNPETSNEIRITTSSASGLPKQGMPSGSGRATLPEKDASPGNLINGTTCSQNNKRMLQIHDRSQQFAKTGEVRNHNGFQKEALWKVGPSGREGSYPTFGREEDNFSPSDSQESLKDWSSSLAYQEDDLRAHLTKRMKISSNLTSSRRDGGLPELGAECHRGGRLGGHYSKQKRQEQVEAIRKVSEEAAISSIEGAQFNKRQSANTSKKGQSRSFAATPEKGVDPTSSPRSKGSMLAAVKETLAFAGPKSLAQIKAEKMAGENFGFKATGRLESSSIITEASPKLSGRNSAVSVASRNAFASSKKVVSSQVNFVSTNTQDDALKHDGLVAPRDFQGLKSLREAEAGSMGKERMSGPFEAQVSEPKSLGEMEDGNVSSNGDSSHVDDMGSLVSLKEGVKATQGLQGSSEEAAECETESSDYGSNADLDMELAAYGGEDYEMDGDGYVDDDDDDDDEDDFAKKLGRVFGLSYD